MQHSTCNYIRQSYDTDYTSIEGNTNKLHFELPVDLVQGYAIYFSILFNEFHV